MLDNFTNNFACGRNKVAGTPKTREFLQVGEFLAKVMGCSALNPFSKSQILSNS